MATVESMVVEEQREPEKPVDREKVAGGIFMQNVFNSRTDLAMTICSLNHNVERSIVL